MLTLCRPTIAGSLVKKAGCNMKIAEIEKKILYHNHGKYITTEEFNKLTADNFAPRIAQAKIATKDDIADLAKETNFDNKLINLNKNKTCSGRK